MKKRGVDFKKRDVSLYFGVLIVGVFLGYVLSETKGDLIGRIIQGSDNLDIEEEVEPEIELVSNYDEYWSREPMVLGVKDGKLFVFYTTGVRTRYGNLAFDIFYSVKDGDTWVREIPAVTSDEDSECKANVLMDSKKDAHLFWKKGCSDPYLFYKKGIITPSNQILWGETIQLPVEPTVFEPKVAIDNRDNFHIVYQGDPRESTLKYIKGEANGTFSREPTILSNFGVTARIATDSRNNVHVVWTGNGVEYKKFDYATQTWKPTVIFGPVGNYPYPKIVTADDGGNLNIFWSVEETLYHTRSEDYGESWSQPNAINFGQEYLNIVGSMSDVDVDSFGKLHFLISLVKSSGDYTYSLYHIFSVDNGVSWSTPELISKNPNFTNTVYPDVYIEDRNLHIIWESRIGQTIREIYYRSKGTISQQIKP